MPRPKKSPDPQPRIEPARQQPEKPKEKKLAIPLLDAKVSALLLARNPSADIRIKLGKASPEVQSFIEQVSSALDELDTFGEQYRYLSALSKRGGISKQLHDAFVGAIVNLRERNKDDRDHELSVRRYMRRAERLYRSASDSRAIPSDRVDALRKKLRSDISYKLVRGHLTDAFIEKLVVLTRKRPVGEKHADQKSEHLTPAELAGVAGILFGDDQKNFLLAFQSAYDIARSHAIPPSDALAEEPTFAHMIAYLRDSLSLVLTEERKKHAFDGASEYSSQKLNQLEDQLRSLEEMTLKLQRNSEDDAVLSRETFAQKRQERTSYAALPAMRELREYGTHEFSQTAEKAREMSGVFIAELHAELKNYYTQLSQMSSIVTAEAADILRRIAINKAVIGNLQEELSSTFDQVEQQAAIPEAQSESVAERRYLNLHNQLRIKDLQGEIEDFQAELGTAANKDKVRLQAYIASRKEQLDGYILLERIGNAEEDLVQLRQQLQYVNAAERRPVQDAIERLTVKIAQLKAEHTDHMRSREAREVAREEKEREKRSKKS